MSSFLDPPPALAGSVRECTVCVWRLLYAHPKAGENSHHGAQALTSLQRLWAAITLALWLVPLVCLLLSMQGASWLCIQGLHPEWCGG